MDTSLDIDWILVASSHELKKKMLPHKPHRFDTILWLIDG